MKKVWNFLLVLTFGLSVLPAEAGEAGATLISAQSAQRNPADLNGSGVVDFADFIIFAQNFGKTGAPFDPSARDTVFLHQVIRDTIIVHTDVERPEETDWQTIFTKERRNVYWLGVGVEEPGYLWVFVGTGFAVATDVICTNAHVVSGLQERISTIRSNLTPLFVAIPADGTGRNAYRLSAENNEILSFWHPNYTGSPSSADVALVFTTKEMPSFSRLVSSLDAMELEVGQEIATMGFPGEIDSNYNPATRPIPTSKIGAISALRPYDEATLSTIFWGRIANKVVQYDFDTTGGTSGSPIFNRRGEVVAVHNASYDTGSLDFGIRADEARDLLRAIYVEVRRDGEIPPFSPEELINARKPVVRTK